MPGPLSPERHRKAQIAKEKERAKSPRRGPPPKDYKPAESSVVWSLPQALTEAEKQWWATFAGDGKAFDQHRGPRGSHNGAAAWVRGKFCEEWWPLFRAEYPDVPDNDKLYYYTHLKIGTLIYSHLHNLTVRDPANESKQGSSSNTKKGSNLLKAPRLKKKAIAHDHWRRSNLGIYKAGVEEYKLKSGTPNWGRLRDLSYKQFIKLSTAEQAHWKKEARDAVQRSQEAAKITDPQERAEFLKGYFKEFREMLADLEAITGVKMCAMILHETPEGKYKITRELSNGIKPFGKSPALASAMGSFQKWYQDTAGQPVENPIPLPTIYPDFANGGIPCMPYFTGLGLDPARHLMRTYISAMFWFQGAIGKVMWTEIKGSLSYWLDPKRVPADWDDPSHLALPIVLVWLDFFLRTQTGEIPLDLRFQFLRVPAGLEPINQSESQETAREEGEHKCKKSIILVFEQTVTKCHHPDGMEYDESSLKYAEFLKNGLIEPEPNIDLFDPPEEWMLLPIPGPDVPESVISGTEEEGILALSDLLPSLQGELVKQILRAAKEHQAQLPATDPQGVYCDDEPPPKAIPPSPNSDPLRMTFWVDPDYYRHPSEAAPQGTVSHFETWQKRMHTLLYHGPSGTLYGGKNGIIRVVRPLIDFIFNFSAVRGDFDPPEAPPPEYDLTRLPINKWPRLQQWTREWTAAIEASTTILRQTAEERRNAPAVLQSLTDNDEPRPQNSTLVPASSPTGPKPKKRRAHKIGALKSKAGKARVVNRDEDEYSTYSLESESDNNGREVNFEELDCTPEDEMSDEELQDFGLEPDNEFTRDDPLGLRAKYDVDSRLPREIIQGTGSLTLDSHAEYSPTALVFEDFTNLLDLIPSRITSPEIVARQLVAFKVEAQRIKAQFTQFGTDNPKLPNELRRLCYTTSQRWAPVEFQPVYQWLFTMRAIWMRARALAPLALAQSAAIAYVLREGSHLQIIAERIIQVGEFPDPLVPVTFLEGLVQESKIFTIELQWIMESLIKWKALSLRHFHAMRGSFAFDELPKTLTEAVVLCQATLSFRDEAIQLTQKLFSDLALLWKAQLKDYSIPKGETVPGFFYTFGAPNTKDIESSLLRGNLAKLQEALANPTLRDEIVQLPVPPTPPTSALGKDAPHTTPAVRQDVTPSDEPAAPIVRHLPTTSEPTPADPSNDEPTTTTTQDSTPHVTRRRPKMRAPPAGNVDKPSSAPSDVQDAGTRDAQSTGAHNAGARDAPAQDTSTQEASAQDAVGVSSSIAEPETIDSAVKRKRGPNSPKAPTRASTRIRGQADVQATVDADEPTGRTTRSRSNARGAGAAGKADVKVTSTRSRKK